VTRIEKIKDLATEMAGQRAPADRAKTLEKVLDELAQLSGDLDNRVLELARASKYVRNVAKKTIKIYAEIT